MFFEVSKNKITHHMILTWIFKQKSFVVLTLSSFSIACGNVYNHTTLKAQISSDYWN